MTQIEDIRLATELRLAGARRRYATILPARDHKRCGTAAECNALAQQIVALERALEAQPIDIELRYEAPYWRAAFWGRSAHILRPVPGNTAPAQVAVWTDKTNALMDLVTLLGALPRVVREYP